MYSKDKWLNSLNVFFRNLVEYIDCKEKEQKASYTPSH